MSEKKNTDYSASAVNLVNPVEVGCKLAELAQLKINQARLEAVLQAYPEYGELAVLHRAQGLLEVQIKELIDEQGSFQDLEAGIYAVKQRREKLTYQVDLVIQHLSSKLADLVLVKTVDSKALDGLVKGKLVTPEEARQCATVKEDFAYIIK